MTFQEYLKSADRRALYQWHPEVQRIGGMKSRLKASIARRPENWEEKYQFMPGPSRPDPGPQ
jgi:hypothetical protein